MEAVSGHPHCHSTLKWTLLTLHVPPGDLHKEKYHDPFLQEVALTCEGVDLFTLGSLPGRAFQNSPHYSDYSYGPHLCSSSLYIFNANRILRLLVSACTSPATSEPSFSHNSWSISLKPFRTGICSHVCCQTSVNHHVFTSPTWIGRIHMVGIKEQMIRYGSFLRQLSVSQC